MRSASFEFKVFYDYCYNNGAGQKNHLTDRQAHVFGSILFRSPEAARLRGINSRRSFYNILRPSLKSPLRPKGDVSKSTGLIMTSEAFYHLLTYDLAWEEFMRFIPGKIIVVS